MIQLQAQACSVQGPSHLRNDDSIFMNANEGVFIVSDGVSEGGHGKLASDLITRLIAERLIEANEAFRRSGEAQSDPKRLQSMHGILQKAFIDTQSTLKARAKSNPDYQTASTTCTAIWFYGRFAILGHIGDSRAYLYRGGKVLQLTQDHVGLEELLKMGFSREAALKNSMARALTRAIGNSQFNHPDFFKIEFQAGDSLFLCSDGFYSGLEKKNRLGDFARDHLDEKGIQPWIEEAARLTGDDSSVVGIRFLQSPETKVNLTKADVRATDRIELVRNAPLSRYLDYFQKAQIAAICEIESYRAGATVLQEGDEGTWMLIVASGSLSVRKGGKLIRRVGAGDFVGEIALIQKGKRSASVIVEDDAVLLSLMRSDLEEIFKKDPQIEAKIYKAMLENALERVVELTAKIEATLV